MPARPQKKRKAAKPANPDAFFTAEEIARVRARTEGKDSGRNPEAVLAAFVEGGMPTQVDGYTIPVIGLGRYMLIERIKSPVLGPGGWDKMDNQQLSELIFVCLQPEPRTRELLAQGGDVFANAVAEFADGIALTSLRALGTAIALRIAQAFSTIISPASSGESASGTAAKKNTAVPRACPSAPTA